MTEAARQAYLALWEKSPQRTPFAHPAFADAVEAVFGLPVRVAHADGAAALVYERKRGPFRAAALPPFAPAAAPVLAPGAPGAALAALLAGVQRGVHQASFLLPYAWTDTAAFARAGWTLTTRQTYVSALPAGADPGTWSANARRLARKSAAAYAVEEDARHVEAAVGLMTASYRRHGAPFGYADAEVARLARAAVEAGLARCFAAVGAGGAVEAALVAAHDDRTGYYWLPGSVPGPAMTVLLAAVLPRLAAAGLTAFDWCGANTPSIAEFKRRFGPALAPVVAARWVRPGPARLLDRLRGMRGGA